MIKKILLLISFQALLWSGFNVQSIGGNFKSVEGNDRIHSYIKLNGKTIYKTEFYTDIEKKYKTKDSEIYVISSNLGGSGTSDSYVIIEIFKDGSYKISKDFVDDDGLPKYKFKNGVLYIDLDYKNKMKKDAVYKNHKLTIIKRKESKIYASDNDCKYLYKNIYSYYTKPSQCSKSLDYDMPMSYVRSVGAMSNDPNIDIDLMYKITKKDCYKRKKRTYKEFKELICKAHGKNKSHSQNRVKGNKFTSNKNSYTVTYNQHGAVLMPVNGGKKLYIGKDCDTFSKIYGKGSWSWNSSGFKVYFKNRTIIFKNQIPKIANIQKCKR